MPQGLDLADVDGNTTRRMGEVVDETYFSMSFAPGAGIGSGTTDLPSVASNLWPAVSFPNGSTTFYLWNFEPRQDWRKLRLKSLTIKYTADAGGTANFGLQLSGHAAASGVNLGTVKTIFGGAWNVVGPANASDPMSATWTTPGADLIQATDFLGAVRIVRDGAGDANNNVFYLLRATMVLAPA